MKYITLIIGLLVVGCGNSDKVKLLEEQSKRLEAEAKVKLLEEKLKEAEEATPTAKPVKELTLEEKVVGTYELKAIGSDATVRMVFLENGIWESYANGKERLEAKWSISKEGEMHVEDEDGYILVHRINEDGSITGIAFIPKDGKREDLPKELQATFKKIK